VTIEFKILSRGRAGIFPPLRRIIVIYSRGKGWELGIEAVIPTTRATGTGAGVIAQLVIQLDYLLPDSVVGRPIFLPTELP